MTPIRIFASTLAAFTIVSCANDKGGGGQYDTAAGNPYGPADASHTPAVPSNPVYDTPAAYEDNPGARPAAPGGAIDPYNPEPSGAVTPSVPTAAVPTAPQAPAAPSNGAAIIHTVVPGDTLSGISAKYKVPSAAIRQANSMKNDTVVLGRKMVIPPVR